MAFSSSELILSPEGKVYHLDLAPEEISHKIILVGDQQRVALVSRFFDTIEMKRQKREFACHTGTYHGIRISVLSTGIGTDNIDIVMNELDILVNYDLQKKVSLPNPQKIELVRIGTCGALHAETPIGSYVLSSGAIGFDNVPHFYPLQYETFEKNLLQHFVSFTQCPNKIAPYYINASSQLIDLLDRHPKIIKGITSTATGFYGPQGRELRIKLPYKNLFGLLAQFSFDGHKIVNLEMETSSLLALSKIFGHEAVSICLALANRETGAFLNNYNEAMDTLIVYVLEQFCK
jgi:uridine phosphorylase